MRNRLKTSPQSTATSGIFLINEKFDMLINRTQSEKLLKVYQVQPIIFLRNMLLKLKNIQDKAWSTKDIFIRPWLRPKKFFYKSNMQNNMIF